MPTKCKNCGGTDLSTDLSAGQVTCNDCYSIVESGILVNEVGFAEGSGGRVHAQGTFVSHHASGIAGFRGQSSAESSEEVKAAGREKIRILAGRMNIAFVVKNSASRLFDLAVGERFNRGRKSEYVIASCLYLASRLKKESYMLIDFSEKLRINVYELGSTYLKLRSILNLNEPMPEVDPAIYNIRFAAHLSFGNKASNIASDASRLVRRFRADWMTQGRRPAGVCGACLILAARMNNYLRTPEEVAQVVKVSPATIRKRLVEFAGTEMAGRTVKEWRDMRDEDLEVEGVETLPPVVKAANLKAEMIRIEALRKVKDEEDKEGEEAQDEAAERKRKRGKGAWSGRDIDDDLRDMDGLIQAAAEEFRATGDEEEDDPDDRDLGSLEKSDYLEALKTTVHETAEDKEKRIADARAFKRANRAHEEVDYSELAALVDANDKEDEAEDDDEEDLGEEGEGKEDEQNEKGDEDMDEHPRPKKQKKAPFTDWSDPEAVITHMTDTYFAEEKQREIYPKAQLRARVEAFINTRDPQTVAEEMNAIKRARRDADKYMRTCRTEDLGFSEAVDEELENVYGMEDDAKFVRARMWLSANKKWMEKNKERQKRTAAYNKAHGIDPNKPKPKKKRAAAHRGPYKSARAAVEGIATQKKFSHRMDYSVLASLGLTAEGLEAMDDDAKDDDKAEDNDKAEELFDGQEDYDPYNEDYGDYVEAVEGQEEYY